MKKKIFMMAILALPFASFATEADLIIPNLHDSLFQNLGISGWELLFYGSIIVILGLLFVL